MAHSEPKGARVIRLGLVLGIEVGIDRSWFAVLAAITWWLSRSDGPFQVLELAPSQRIVVSLLAAILFFVSVLIHELIYVLIVRRFGDRADGLTLYSLGGIARSESEVAIPIHSTWLLLVTPLVYVLVAGFCLACGAYGPSSAAWATLLMFLAGANAALAALNLLPVYPFDGGRVLHAIMWRYMGDRIRATRVSITIARILGLLFALYAVRQLMASDLSGALWPMLIGLFMLQTSSAEALHALFATSLHEHSALDLVTHFGDPLPANASAEDGAKAILRGAHAPVPVHIAGNCIGVLSPLDFRKIAGRDWANIPVTALMTRWDDLDRITPAASAVNAVRSLRRSTRSHLAVITTDGNLIGFINSAGVARFISKRSRARAPRLTIIGRKAKSP